MDVELSKVERGGLEQYEQEAVEGNFEEEKTEGGNSEVEKYKVIWGKWWCLYPFYVKDFEDVLYE